MTPSHRQVRLRKQKETLFARLQDHRFNILLGSLVALFVSMPVVQSFFPGKDHTFARCSVTVLFVLMLLSSILAVSKRTATERIALGLAIPAIVFGLAVLVTDKFVVELAAHLFNVAFLGFTGLLILAYVFSVREVTFDTISASLCVYFLLALMWAVVFSLLTLIEPASFHIGFEEHAMQQTAMHFGGGNTIFPIYFSLVTITTLGYGDISPATPLACTFSACEAVMGQLYLAVLVARLVGLHTSQSFRKRFGEDG